MPGSTRQFARCLLGLFVALLFTLPAFSQLRNAAAGRLSVGAAVNIDAFNNTSGEPQYRPTLSREYNMLVAENVMKFDTIHPAQNTYNFTQADQLVAFAQANGMKVRGHVLIWHNQIPSWVTNGNFTRDQVIAIMQDHITTVMQHFAGKVVAWDVVNEAVSDNNGAMRTDSFWFQKIGQDYIQMAYQFARQADPNAKLYYNDYEIEQPGPKADTAFSIVSGLRQQGLIDGIGWQMHKVNPFRITSANETNAARFLNLGLEMTVTEMDIRQTLPSTPTSLQQQALGYGDVMRFCLTRCAALVTWGFTDKFSWVPGTFPGQGDALPFDMNYQPKPAYTAMLNELGGTLPAPTGLAATAGNAQVSLTWNAVTGATSYNVKRATTSGGPYVLAGTATGTSFTNTGLTNGTTYFFVVSAVSSSGESPNSAEVSATPSGGTAGFTIAFSPTSLTVNQGASGTSTINITRTNFTSGIACTASGMPSGVSATFNPTSTTGNSIAMTLAAAATATAGGPTNITVSCTGGTLPARTATLTLTVGGGGGNGGVTVTPAVASSSPFFNELQVRLANTQTISALTVTVVIQRTTGVSFSGQYNTIGGQITQSNSSTTSAITYTFRLSSGTLAPATSGRTFAAQASGSGTAHPTSGDTWTATYTVGGQNFTQTGTF